MPPPRAVDGEPNTPAPPPAPSAGDAVPHFARLVEAPPSGAPGPAGQQPRAAAMPLPSTPPELEGLRLTASGDLVDATGRPLPGLGEPSRFDIACAAMRGDLDPPPWRPDDERSPAALVAALLGPFPLDYDFNAVVRLEAEGGGRGAARAVADALAAAVHAAAACPGPVPRTAAEGEEEEEAGAGAGAGAPAPSGATGAAAGAASAAAAPAAAGGGGGGGGGKVTFKERMGGKYVSVCIRVRVRSAELVEEGFAALARDERVVMRF